MEHVMTDVETIFQLYGKKNQTSAHKHLIPQMKRTHRQFNSWSENPICTGSQLNIPKHFEEITSIEQICLYVKLIDVSQVGQLISLRLETRWHVKWWKSANVCSIFSKLLISLFKRRKKDFIPVSKIQGWEHTYFAYTWQNYRVINMNLWEIAYRQHASYYYHNQYHRGN